MNHLLKSSIKSLKLIPVNNVAEVNHVGAMFKRNFGCATQQYKIHRQETNKRQLNKLPLRFNSTAAAAATTAPLDPGFFASFYQSLSTSTPVAYVQQGLIEIHDFTGLPWWASIIATTFLFRSVVTLPLTIYQHKITARIEKISLEMPAIVEELKKEAAMAMRKFKWTEKQTKIVYQRSIRKQWNKLVVRDNCHPAKTFIVLWGQIPLWIFQSMALRNMVSLMPDPTSLQAQIVATELTIGGFGWIPNLTEVDSSYILPVTLGLINLGIIEMQSMMRTRPATRFHNIITNVFRGLSLVMVPVACSVPSALTVYWVASSSYGLVQNLLLASPQVKRAFGIPKTQSELENPYEHLWSKMKQRVGLEKLPVEEVKVVEKLSETKPTTGIKRK
ncbi:cytochrome c oxidase assembly protein COX18, mitochondrial [Lucilia sericata]|uniref:cytochrome c oxidase assembly protein COX18, mitochondrial n=1 Tax=Lucilia sericata TaxID=13632 RepID=UPI0018A840A1|nr:cytochrome c oxidase assembly protein COX18, mitochondrial [Lucilia sericata]